MTTVRVARLPGPSWLGSLCWPEPRAGQRSNPWLPVGKALLALVSVISDYGDTSTGATLKVGQPPTRRPLKRCKGTSNIISVSSRGGGCVHPGCFRIARLLVLVGYRPTRGPITTVPRCFCGSCQTQHRWLVALRSATPDRQFSGIGSVHTGRNGCTSPSTPKTGAAEVTVHAHRCHSPPAPAGWATRPLAQLGWQPNPRFSVLPLFSPLRYRPV